MKVDKDEGPSRFNEEKLRKLSPAFGPQGTVTAGNASSVNDGAAAIVVLSAEKASSLGVKPQAKILGYATFSREPEWFTLAPIGAIGGCSNGSCSKPPMSICMKSTRLSRWFRWPP